MMSSLDLALATAVGATLLVGGVVMMTDLTEIGTERATELEAVIGDKAGTKGLSKRLKDAIACIEKPDKAGC